MSQYILIGAFILIPFAILARGIIHIGQEFGFILGAMAVAGSRITNRWARIFIFYFLIWQVVLLVRAFLNPGDYQSESALGTLFYFFAAIIFFIAVCESKLRNETFFKVSCFAALIQATLAILQRMGFDIPYKLISLITPVERLLGDYAPVGTLGNSNFLAAFLAISLPFFFRLGWWKYLPIILWGLMAANAGTANAAVIFGFSYFFWGKKGAGISVLLAGIYLAFIHRVPLDSERFSWWLQAVAEISRSWQTILFGRGPGSSWLSPLPWVYEAIHNEYVSTLYQYGLIGLICLAGVLKSLISQNRILLTALIIAAVNCMGNFPLHLAPSTVLIILIVGLIQREKRKSNQCENLAPA